MAFQVSGLDYAEFAPLFGMNDEQLHERGIVRQVADVRPGFPCRVSLQDAQPGQTLLLLNYEHLAVATPYRSRHAIFVCENAQRAELDVNEIPEVMRTRLLSLRAFDRAGMMLDADVVQADALVPAIERMLGDANVEFIHAHNAKRGCYSARIDRVG